jgi:hypothetical protein
MNSGTPDDAVTGQAPENESEKTEPEAASEQRPIAYSEQTPEERGAAILEEAASLSKREFRRRETQIHWRLKRATGQEWSLPDVISEVEYLRQQRQSAPQPNRSTDQSAPTPPKLVRIGSLIRDEYCKEGAGLLPQHRQRIVDSAIKPEVARDRGYRTIWTKKELGNYGFGPSQRITPTLLVPLYDPKGKLAGY